MELEMKKADYMSLFFTQNMSEFVFGSMVVAETSEKTKTRLDFKR